MTDSSFILNFLPDFYKNNIVSEDGRSLLTPIFDNFVNAMGDQLYQAQQISILPYLFKTKFYIEETFKTIDTSNSNRYKTGYKIDNSIIKFDGLYYDGKFTLLCNISYTIYHDIAKDIRYIVFASQINQDTIFVKSCRKDLKTMQKIFGVLLQHVVEIPDMSLATSDYVISYLDIESLYKKYYNELIAIQYGLVNGPSLTVLNNMVGIYSNLPYSPFDGIIINIDGNSVTIKDNNSTDIVTLTCTHINPTFYLGQRITRFTILEKPCYRFLTLYDNPARFASYLLGYWGLLTNNLLYLNKADKEKDASLYFDSQISWDDLGVCWDMGHNYGDSTSPTDINQPYIPSWNNNDSRFIFNPYFVDTGFVDPGFVDGDTQQIYEMFRNIIIFEYTDSNISSNYDVLNFTPLLTDKLKNLLRRTIATYTKAIYLTPMYFVENGFVDIGFVD